MSPQLHMCRVCHACERRYAKLSPSEIRLDRYAKFRKLGMYEEFLVRGGQWREARAARAAVSSPQCHPHICSAGCSTSF